MGFRAYAPGLEAQLAAARVERVEARGLSPGVWLAEVSRLVDEFYLAMIDWELEDELGNPIPLTLETLRRQDVPFLCALLKAWGQTIHVQQVPPEEEPSSIEASLDIPMTPLIPEEAPPAPARKPRKPRTRTAKTAAA